MNSFGFKFKQLLYFVSLIMFVFQSCDKKEDPAPTENLSMLIASNPDLSIFKAALEKSELTIFTDGSGPFTILAPNNAAFNAIGITSAADLTLIDRNLLVNLMTYHIIPGSRTIIEITKGTNTPITTQLGSTVYASKSSEANASFVNGAKIVTPDILASNGVIQVINKVLLYPTSNVLALLTTNPNYSLFVQAITKGAANANFTATGPITVFAPDNAAMTAAGYTSTFINGSTAATMLALVRYHIFNNRLFSSDFSNVSLKTVQGSNITLSITGGSKVKGTNNSTAISITGGDILATNGVIHTISGVLKP